MTTPEKNQPLIIRLPEHLSRAWVEENLPLLKGKPVRTLVLDFTRTTTMDSAGVAFVHVLHRLYRAANHTLSLERISPALRSMLESWKSTGAESSAKSEPERGLAGLGGMVLNGVDQFVHALSMLTEMLYWGTFGLLKRRDFRKGVLGDQMYQLGFKALGIVSLLAFLIGVVLALQAAMQLRTFGAGIFLAPMIGISMIKELGPLLTAIILAGRSGSATTAEIATMVVGEEIDALQTMGLNPVQFVVVPKFWAITLTMPLLSIIVTAIGIVGGFVVSVFYLDIASSLYWSELSKNIFLHDVRVGVTKSIAFSWLIVWIGSYYGFRTRGGAEAVGRETTGSVVTAIFAIIMADAIFSFVL
jgi:phospholipid/cholesterol/gamma-HCH transport system permease protein